jgi:hypothetical protein
MTILWCGGEDIDFPNGVFGSAGTWDTDFARTANHGSSFCQSNKFSDTPIESIWLSQRIYTYPSSGRFGTGLSMFGSYDGIYIGCTTKIALYKYSGTTWALLMEESGNNNVNGFLEIDMQISNFGINANVSVYCNGNLIIEYTGDITTPNIENGFDCVSIGNDSNYFYPSEIIVADEDTRLMRLKTLAPSAAGDTSANWTGAYTDIDETTLSDSDKIYSSTNNADFQCNLTGMPSGAWSVKAVKVAARCVDGSGSTGIQLGVKSGGTVGSGNTQTASGYWQTKEILMQVNPVTGVAFTPAEIEALQINLRAATL